MEQLSLFDNMDPNFYEKLQEFLDSIIQKNELPTHSLHLFSNIAPRGKNAGMETSKSICIYEPEYPLIKEDIDNPGKNMVVLNIKENKVFELLIRNAQFECINLPETATVKKSKDNVFKHVLFEKDDPSIFPYIAQNISFCLKNYRSKEKTFGCCSQFIKCSDAKRCLHANKLYSTACQYRHNLEAGRIFYGKNKNV